MEWSFWETFWQSLYTCNQAAPVEPRASGHLCQRSGCLWPHKLSDTDDPISLTHMAPYWKRPGRPLARERCTNVINSHAAFPLITISEADDPPDGSREGQQVPNTMSQHRQLPPAASPHVGILSPHVISRRRESTGHHFEKRQKLHSYHLQYSILP